MLNKRHNLHLPKLCSAGSRSGVNWAGTRWKCWERWGEERNRLQFWRPESKENLQKQRENKRKCICLKKEKNNDGVFFCAFQIFYVSLKSGYPWSSQQSKNGQFLARFQHCSKKKLEKTVRQWVCFHFSLSLILSDSFTAFCTGRETTRHSVLHAKLLHIHLSHQLCWSLLASSGTLNLACSASTTTYVETLRDPALSGSLWICESLCMTEHCTHNQRWDSYVCVHCIYK